MAEESLKIEFVNVRRRNILFAPKVAVLTVGRNDHTTPVQIDTSIPHIVRRFYAMTIYVFMPEDVNGFLVTEKMSGRTKYVAGFYFPIIDLVTLHGLRILQAVKSFR